MDPASLAISQSLQE
jgi:hypothetical protein